MARKKSYAFNRELTLLLPQNPNSPYDVVIHQLGIDYNVTYYNKGRKQGMAWLHYCVDECQR